MALISRYVIRAAALSLGGFHLYTAYFGTFYPYTQRAIPVLLSMILAFLVYNAAGKMREDGETPSIVDWLLVALSVPVFGFIAINSDYLANRWPMTPTFAPTTLEIVYASLSVILLLEATRRVLGWVLVIFVGLALAYVYLGEFVSWKLLSHRGFTFVQIADQMYLTLEGIWGTALGVAATYIVLFVIFGAFAEKAGVSEFFLRFALALAGKSRGGPAKVAIFSSGLVGSVTGSTVANVYATGVFTIPMMKRIGYRPASAGAIEALASNGGQIMPPILGAAAFVIAASVGVPYVKIALAALLPALIYYGLLLWSIHLEACKSGLEGLPASELPSLTDVLLKTGHLALPIVAIFVLLLYGLSPMRAALYTIGFTIALSWIRKETRIGPREFMQALEAGAKGSVMIIIVCAVIGFVVGTFTLTGLGLNITSAIVHLAGGSYFLVLLYVGLASLILGTGMNTVAAYLLASVIAVPALIDQGITPLVAHLYVFMFALLSHITPPVCMAIYAGADIAKADPWETAFAGMRMGIVAYLLPFLIVFAPGLVLADSWSEIAKDGVTTLAGGALVVAAVQGWMRFHMNYAERLLALLAGVFLLLPTNNHAFIGAGLAVAVVLVSVVFRGKWTKGAVDAGGSTTD